MEVIYLLVPLSIVLVAIIVAAFLWAMSHGQFSDLERRGRDILFDDEQSGGEGAVSDDGRPESDRR